MRDSRSVLLPTAGPRRMRDHVQQGRTVTSPDLPLLLPSFSPFLASHRIASHRRPFLVPFPSVLPFVRPRPLLIYLCDPDYPPVPSFFLLVLLTRAHATPHQSCRIIHSPSGALCFWIAREHSTGLKKSKRPRAKRPTVVTINADFRPKRDKYFLRSRTRALLSASCLRAYKRG